MSLLKTHMDHVVEQLERGRARITDPVRWTTGCYARDESGSSTLPWSSDAVSWCGAGAIRFDPGTADIAALSYLMAAAAEAGFVSASTLNDFGDHGETLAMYDRAIEKARGDHEDSIP